MSPVLLIPIAVLGLFGVLLYRRLVRAPRYTSPWVRWGAIAALVALSAAIFVGFSYQGGGLDHPVARWVGTIGMTWIATAFYLLLGSLVGAVGALVLRILRRGPQARRTWHRRSVPVIVAASLLITGWGLLEARQVSVQETSIAIEGLPEEFDGYRVALISDLHVGPIRGDRLTRQVVELANAGEPDLVLLAGDLTDGTTDQFAEVLGPLADLRAADGVLAATGNHEYYAGDAAGWVSWWRELGITPLLNDSVPISRDGASIRIAGVSDEAGESGGFGGGSDAPSTPGLLPDLGAALADVGADEVSILVAHQPGVAEDERVRAAGVDVMVSGHTHGGQIWPFTLVVALANPTVSGWDSVAGTTTFTTVGAGTWGPPTRVLVPPEVVVITLTAG
ncbi:MAG: metallophosphoesterase [Actinomycetia bacterium]|nr:metallophosphoesterase [Actinomycetes bacterium]